MSQVKRKQYKSVKSGKKRSVLYVLILVIVAIISCGMFYIAENVSYKPPKAEENALAGLPEPKESFMFSTIETDYGFSINMAANRLLPYLLKNHNQFRFLFTLQMSKKTM